MLTTGCCKISKGGVAMHTERFSLILFVLCVLIISVCPGRAAIAGQAAMDNDESAILSAITAARDKDIDAKVDKFIADYGGQPLCYEALYSIASKLEDKKYFAKAAQTYQQLVNLFPNCPYYEDARIAAAKADVLYLIETGADAQPAIEKLMADFAQHPGLAGALYETAERYERKKNFDKAVEIYRLAGEKGAGTAYADNAPLDIQKVAVLKAVESGQDASKMIEKFQSDFAGHPALPAAMYRIAERYERAKNGVCDAKARDIYRQIAEDYSDSPLGGKAKLNAAKMNILKAIMAGSDVQADIDRLISDFGEHPDLPMALYTITVRYLEPKKFDKARDVYGIIASRFPQSSYATMAALKGPESNILYLIESGNMEQAQTELDRLISNFSGDPHLVEALYHIAERYQDCPKPDYDKAAALYEKVIAEYPSSRYAARAKVFAVAKDVLAMIDSFVDDPNQNVTIEQIKTALAKLKGDFVNDPQLYAALLHVADESYAKGLEQSGRQKDAGGDLFRLSFEVLQNDVISKTGNKTLECWAYYTSALDSYKLGYSKEAIEFSGKVLERDPCSPYAPFMQWLIADGYEKLKAAGKISGPEADELIEKAYQKLLASYPKSTFADSAALQLGQLNMQQGKYTTAIAYFEWFIMNGTSRDYASRLAEVNRIVEKYKEAEQ
jgi:outer membrane protein assembly factor BamD (BamD/ComL family)